MWTNGTGKGEKGEFGVFNRVLPKFYQWNGKLWKYSIEFNKLDMVTWGRMSCKFLGYEGHCLSQKNSWKPCVKLRVSETMIKLKSVVHSNEHHECQVCPVINTSV